MSDFLKVKPIEQALEIIDNHPTPLLSTVNIKTIDSLSRTVSTPITSPSDLPSFDRSTMDGYAVRATDTYGASQSQPSYLNLVSEITMGSIPKTKIKVGQAAKIFTGVEMDSSPKG